MNSNKSGFDCSSLTLQKIVNDAIELRFRLMANDLLPDEEES
jgi:hypothetical protein